MIDGLIAGKLAGKPTQRTGQSGKTFTTAKARVPAGESAIFVSVICFSESAQTALLALDDGDSVALTGSLTPKAYADRNGEPCASLDLIAHAVISAYHVKRKREAMQAGRQAEQDTRKASAAYMAAMGGGGVSSVADLVDDAL